MVDLNYVQAATGKINRPLPQAVLTFARLAVVLFGAWDYNHFAPTERARMTSLLLINPAAAHNRRTSVAVLCVLLMLLSVACAKRSRATAPNATTTPDNYASASLATQRININAAPAHELEALPGIGKGLADRIVEHREKYGPFRRPEHLMMVRGISEKRFSVLRDLVTVE